MKRWARMMYQPNLPLRDGNYVTGSKEHRALAKEAAKEGMVLLKNEGNILPLQAGAKVALFGKGTFDYVKGGGGSGDVPVKDCKNLYDGMKKLSAQVSIYEPVCDYYRENVAKQYKDGAAPGMTVEPKLSTELVKGARAFADTAVISISRFSGEGWDRSSIEYNGEYNPWETETSMPQTAGKIFPEGDFYLTKEEKAMVLAVKQSFDKIVVVLNIGGIIDTSWIKSDDQIAGALISWQAGMEGAFAAAEILCGLANPCGKLTDTLAADVTDYPSVANFHESVDYVDYSEDIYVGYRYFETISGAKERVCYPFGFGLSYTRFQIEVEAAYEEEQDVTFQVGVTNVGSMSGKEVVQVYYSAPQGLLQKPAKELGAFGKTRLLLPGERQTLLLSVAKATMSSFDDLGKVQKSAYVLEKGDYGFFVGNSVEDAAESVYTLTMEENLVVEQLTSKCAPNSLKERLCADGSMEALPQSACPDKDECVLEKMVPGTEEALVPEVRARARYLMMNPYPQGAKGFECVADGTMTMEDFMAQLSDENLIALLGGQPNTSVANTYGYGNLPEYGVPSAMTGDGPAGLRLNTDCGVYTTAWPCATLLACTWNTELVGQVGKAGAEEVKENNLAVWLTPAINIHRNPLCGRNFEYYSEDPFLTGKIGAAMVKGIQSEHIAAAVKHFACNNKETNRKHSDSRVSERAMREIYLKGFEIIVKEADPWVIMSSYNVINGYRASENKELLEDILRGEWNFGGMVTSDWWTRGEHYKEIKAGNDVKMACGFPERVKKAMELGALDRSDLERCAKRVLNLILKFE